MVVKEVKIFILVEVILLALKVLAGIVCNSNTMLASAILEIVLITSSLFVLKQRDNKKYKGIISSVYGFIVILLGLGITFYSVVSDIKKVSWLILLFIFISVLVRYIVGCFYSNTNYKKKKGILGYTNLNSNTDFYIAGILLVVLILSKLSKWVNILKYADIIGTVLVSLFVIYKGIKIIKNSFRYLEDKENEFIEYEKEINDRKEVKRLISINTYAFGGLRKAKCNLVLSDSLTMIDVTSFVVTLQDYLLKIADVVEVNLLADIKPKKPKVRSLKQDARNSGSRNSKTNTNKKNTKKKNKKR